MVKIYTLADPETEEIRYIGKTKYSLNDRLAKHMITYERNHRANWIRKLKKKDLKPIIELIEEVDDDIWIMSEKYWIAQFRAWGFNLLNATEGGESGIVSEACRKAHKLKVKGRKRKQSAVLLSAEKNSKAVLQYSKQGIFIKEYSSVSEASRQTGAQLSHITECCNKKPKRKTANKYIWKYKN